MTHARLAPAALAALLTLSATTTPAAVPATKPATTSPVDALNAQADAAWLKVMASAKQFIALTQDGATLRDPAKAAAVRPKVVALWRQLLADGLESRRLNERATEAAGLPQPVPSFKDSFMNSAVLRFGPFLVACGDAETAGLARDMAASPDPAKAEAGRLVRAAADFLTAPDAEAQVKAMEQYIAVVKALDPQDSRGDLNVVLKLPTFTPELAQRRRARLVEAFPDAPVGQALAQQVRDENAVKAWVGKPMVVRGATLGGETFSTAAWKGKVVLVDFWATWCAPCKASLPRLKETYRTYHGQGLEVLGVSNDYKKDALEAFLAADPGMPWPELFDPKAAADDKFHPVAGEFGVKGIPQTFLIDRTGVCRAVDPAEVEKLLPVLLARTAD